MIRRGLLAGAVALLVIPVLAGCQAGLDAPTLEFHPASNGAHTFINGITISNAFVLAAPSGSSLPAGSNAGLFLGLFNNNGPTSSGSGDDTLIGVTLPNGGAASATITGGSVALPANSGVNLTGPAPEIVLNGLTAPLSGGQDIEVTLTFQNAGQAILDVPVEPQSYQYSPLEQPPSPTPTPSATPTPTPSATPSTSATPTSTK